MNKGVTLIEALVSVVILAISVTAGMQLYISNLKITNQQDEYYYAENIMREKMELFKNDPASIDNSNLWIKIAGSSRLKSSTPQIYTGVDGKQITYTIYLDTAIYKVDQANFPLARLKSVKTEITWGAENDKKLSMSTLIRYDYPRPPVGNN